MVMKDKCVGPANFSSRSFWSLRARRRMPASPCSATMTIELNLADSDDSRLRVLPRRPRRGVDPCLGLLSGRKMMPGASHRRGMAPPARRNDDPHDAPRSAL